MGEGDAKLQMMIGAFLGWRAVIFTLLLGACQGVLAVGLMLLRRPMAPTEAIEESEPEGAEQGSLQAPHYEGDAPPEHLGHMKVKFGPFLALAALEYVFFGEWLIEAYLGLLRP